jgi:predicted nucleic acid-binding protein
VDGIESPNRFDGGGLACAIAYRLSISTSNQRRVASKSLRRWTRIPFPNKAEELLAMFEVSYPNEGVVRTALRGAAAYQLSWFDAHVWAHAEHYGLTELCSEDFQHDRLYGSVRAIDPFA